MAVAVAYPHIVKNAGEPACLERHPRTRVAQIVMGYLYHGWSVDEICRQYPYLTPSEAHSAMAYYFDYPDEIDAEIKAEELESTRLRANQPPTAVAAKLRAKGLL